MRPPEGVCDVGEGVLAQDVEGEAAGTGDDAGVAADAALVLAAGHVADVVVAVLDAPVPADGSGPCGGG